MSSSRGLGLLAAAGVAFALSKFLRRSEEASSEAPSSEAPVLGDLAGKTVLVTGASRGLGLEFVKVCLERGAVVYATCRSPSKASGLEALKCDRLFVRALDTSAPAQAAAVSAEIVKSGKALDLLINNAGIASSNHPVDPIVKNDVSDLMKVLGTNVGGTLNTTKALLPAMEGGAKVIATLSSDLGSIEKTFSAQSAKVQAGGVSSYRISKAALNMATRVFAAELAADGFVVVALSPGWVATDMGNSGGRTAPLSPNESITSCLGVIQRLVPSDNGRFLGYNGAKLPW